jgi:NAD(P)H-nitrite reductase large subunit
MEQVVICRCEDVSLFCVQSAIREGARTAQEVKLRTRSGMGICQGRTCRPLIEQLLFSVSPAAVVAAHPHRFPIRPVLLSELSSTSEKGEKS